jgi:hypothetical protein
MFPVSPEVKALVVKALPKRNGKPRRLAVDEILE